MSAAVQAQELRSKQEKSGFRPDIQGLRAIAVLLVVLYHSGVPWLSGGYVGVDVFFVISGFLITTHLLESLQRTGRIHFGAFYAKRARRILPAAMTVAGCTVVAAWIWMPPLLLREVFLAAVATALYVPNIFFAVQGTNYLSESAPSVFQHYWSLGIEEQFYLFWPAILAFGFWLFKRSERALLVAVVTVTAASFVSSIVAMDISQPWAFFSLPTRAWELGVGALVAFFIRSGNRELSRPAAGILAWGGLAALIFSALFYNSGTSFPGLHAALPVLASALLVIGGAAPGKLHAGKVLGWGFFQHVGSISYSLYLIHWPLQVIPQAALGLNNPLPLWVRLVLGLLAFPLAVVLHRYVEMPAMRLRPLTGGRPLRSGLAAAAASTIVVALAASCFIVTSSTSLASDRVVLQSLMKMAPAGTSFVPANLTPGLRNASSDNPAIYANGCHRSFDSTDASGCQIGSNEKAPLVFLFGDSHAASWYPALAALAEQGDIRLDSNTKSSCHSVDVAKTLNGVEYVACATWRSGVIDRIRAERPALVLIANYGHSDLISQAPFLTAWEEGLNRTLDAIAPVTAAVVADVPDNGETPAICLSTHIEDVQPCLLPREEQLDAPTAASERSATAKAQVVYLDFNSYLCNDLSCPPIIDNLLVYRDAHHLTATFSESMRDVVWEHIRPVLARSSG